MTQGKLFPDVDDIIAMLSSDQKQAIVILVIPSHTRREKKIPDQDIWASEGLRLMGDLYRGATAFKTFKGVYKTDKGKYLYDEPILIESYAWEQDIEDKHKLNKLVEFARRMGKETDQEAVMLVFDAVMYYVNPRR